MINRIQPTLPARQMRTFGIRVPGHAQRRATCEQVDCEYWRDGWRTIVPSDSAGAHYIRRESGRRYVETVAAAGLSEFVFEAGQTCFGADGHWLFEPDGVVFGSRDGDWRGNPSGRSQRYERAEDWRDDMGETLDRVRERINRG